MNDNRHGRLIASALTLCAVVAGGTLTFGHGQESRARSLTDHPAIQYAGRPTTDRVAKLNQALVRGERSLARESRTGYLASALQALGVPPESQLLVFSKTGVQRAYVSPRNPRALYFDDSVVVGYVPGAPVIEVAAHDPQQGTVFYTLDQSAARPVFNRQTTCLTCHVSASTLDVPGLIARSHAVDDEGNMMMFLDNNDVDHRTPHADRWGGWFVTSEAGEAPYSQRAHEGNITLSGRGNTSNQVFVDWVNSEPETRGYLSASSDVVALLAFDHQAHAMNLITRLNWESRIVSSSGGRDEAIDRLANELAEYLLFVGEARLPVALVPRPGFAERLRSGTPKDARGRSLAQLDLVNGLLRYPCSYLIYSEAFDGLPPAAKTAVYHRMIDLLTTDDPRRGRLTAANRLAILDILNATKPDFRDR